MLAIQCKTVPLQRPVVYWYLTFHCNLACKHCWVNSLPQVRTDNDLTPEEALTAIEKIEELQAFVNLTGGEVLFVNLTGGEVLTRPDIRPTLESLISRRINFGLETNGILLINRGILEILQVGLQVGLSIVVGVSVDGGQAETHNWQRGSGAFERTMRGLDCLKEYEIPLSIQCVINQRNLNDIPLIVRLSENLGCERVQFVAVHPVGRGKQNFDELGLSIEGYHEMVRLIDECAERYPIKIILKIPPAFIPPHHLRLFLKGNVHFTTGCRFPSVGILPNGIITICALTEHNKQLILGDIRRDSLAKIWQSPVINQLREAYQKGLLQGVCADCIFKFVCKGSCRAYTYTEGGTFWGPHPLCHWLVENGYFPQMYRISHLEGVYEELRRT